MALNDVPKKPADQFVPKASPEGDDIFVFWDRITKKMARASITQFITWIKTQFTYAEAEHTHTLEEVDDLPDTLISHQTNIQTLQNEVAELNELLNKPPAPPTGVEMVTEPGVTFNDTLVQVDAEGKFRWQGVEKPYPAQNLQAAEKPVDGLIRVDALYAKSDSTYGLKKGDAGTEATRPPIPAGTIWVRDIIWTSAGGSTGTPDTVNFNYASYTAKATPADTAVFLVQESSGTKYKWSLSQLIAWLGTKNIGAGGTETILVDLGNRTTNYPLKFDKKYIVTASIGAAIEITADTTVESGFKPGTPSLLVLNCAAGFVPALPAPFIKKNGEFIAGTKNYVECLAISSTEILYEIYQ